MTKNLIKIGKLQEYHTVLREQIDNGILEPVPEKSTGETVHYIPLQPVIREGAESTKLRIVFDYSASPNANTPPMNKCGKKWPITSDLHSFSLSFSLSMNLFTFDCLLSCIFID